MIKNEGAIRSYLRELGFTPDIADIYFALHTYGPQTISQVSRNAGIERTRMYRLLDELTASNLVEIETQYKRHIYRAAPITNLRITIARQEQRLRSLQAELDTIEHALPPNALDSPSTRVQFYQGEEGVKQMLWNQTKAKSDSLAILYENIQSYTGEAFFDRWVHECNLRGHRTRGIIGDEFIASQKEWYGTRQNEQLTLWQPRYISKDIFPITHSHITYDDVVAYYNWKSNEIFGIEIYNHQIAIAQRHFFKLLWQQAKPIDDGRGKPAK